MNELILILVAMAMANAGCKDYSIKDFTPKAAQAGWSGPKGLPEPFP